MKATSRPSPDLDRERNRPCVSVGHIVELIDGENEDKVRGVGGDDTGSAPRSETKEKFRSRNDVLVDCRSLEGMTESKGKDPHTQHETRGHVLITVHTRCTVETITDVSGISHNSLQQATAPTRRVLKSHTIAQRT
jgi:hypothetical protein